LRKPQRLEQFLTVCEADKRGRLGMSETDYPQGGYLRAAFHAACEVKAAAFLAEGLQGPAIADAMRKARVQIIAKLKVEGNPRPD
jgi:tRNA nucleotidyltransferase (CCA-adding enzyme)